MAIAIAVTQQDSLKAAIDSAMNTARLVQDFMYGTPARARLTTAFALAMAGAGMLLESMTTPAFLTVCS